MSTELVGWGDEGTSAFPRCKTAATSSSSSCRWGSFVTPTYELPLSGLFALGTDHRLHAAESRIDRRRLHAHGMGAAVAGVCDSGATDVSSGAGGVDGDRSRLYVGDAVVVFPLISRVRSAHHLISKRYA